MRFGILVPIVVALLAGCLNGGPDNMRVPEDEIVKPSEPADLGELRAFEARGADGVALRGHVYLPEGDGPFATILTYNPYDNLAQFGEASDARAHVVGNRTTLVEPYDTFLDAGYAVAFMNMRGTGLSDGCNAYNDPHVDGPDAAAVIEALASSSWSDGAVGMVGISWHGYSQYAALMEPPDSLRAVAPASAILDLWSLETRYGAPINTQYGPPTSSFTVFHLITTWGPDPVPDHLDCPSTVEMLAAAHELAVNGDKTAWFHKRELHDVLAGNQVPMLVSNGLGKLYEGHILQIDGLWPLMNEESRLVIGQWPHAYPTSMPGGADYWQEVLAFMDHHVRGIGPTPVAGVVDVEDLAGVWHRWGAWPPAANVTRLHLSQGSLVTAPEDVGASVQALQATNHDPQVDGCLGDKAVYISPPLAQDVLLAGNFQANLTVTSTHPDGNIGVFLWDLDDLPGCGTQAPDVQVPSVTIGSYEHEVSRALSDLAHRGHLEHGAPFPVGVPEVLGMHSHPFATPVNAGERLALVVTGGSRELSADTLRPQLTVHTGDGVEGWIDVPVVEGELVFS